MSRRRFEFLLLANRQQGIEMLLGDGGLVSSLRDIDARLIEFLPRQGALLEKLLAALKDLLLRVQGLLSLLGVRFGLLDLLGQTRSSGCFVRRLCLFVCAFGILRGGRQVAILENCQKLALPLPHFRASPEISAPGR